MKRSLLALALLAVAGSASAQAAGGALRINRAVATLVAGNVRFPDGLAGSVPFFLAGNTTQGFLAGRNGFSGFVVVLTENAPALDGLRENSVQMFNNFYDALLPTYTALDKVLIPLAEPAAPITGPVGTTVVVGARTLAAGLNAVLSGTEGLSMR